MTATTPTLTDVAIREAFRKVGGPFITEEVVTILVDAGLAKDTSPGGEFTRLYKELDRYLDDLDGGYADFADRELVQGLLDDMLDQLLAFADPHEQLSRLASFANIRKTAYELLEAHG